MDFDRTLASSRPPLRRLLVFMAALLAAAPGVAPAAPALRYQVDQRGDFVIIGNTLAQECAAGTPAPQAGTVGACGSNLDDLGADVFWTTDGTTARADNTVTPANASSQAALTLPAGAEVTYARLYWAALRSTPARTGPATPDTTVTLSRPGTFTASVTADGSAGGSTGGYYAYQSTADVTALVKQNGVGKYLLSGADSVDIRDLNDSVVFAGWSLVVFYKLSSDPLRNLTIFDGLDVVASGAPANATLSGFLVPSAGYTARLGVIAYEGEYTITGDAFRFNNTALADAQNPADNFFNGSRGRLGSPDSVAGDLPRFTGQPNSLEGLDLDVVDITARVSPGQTSATVSATSTQDIYLLGAFITSIATQKPDFTSTVKSVRNTTTRADNSIRPGDTLEYTITTSNTGDDSGIQTVLTDTLPSGVTYVPGSLQVTAGANTGAKTDVSGDDQGEYSAGKLTVRLGTGANATQGGTIIKGGSTTVVFRVTVNTSATGTINNQAIVQSAGQSGAPTTQYPSSPPSGTGPTPVTLGGPPAPTLTSPASGVTVTTRTPTLSGTAEAGNTVTVKVDGTTVCTTTANASGVWSCTSTVSLPDGARTATVQSRDPANNASPITTQGFNVDATAPAAPAVTTPTANAVVATRTPTLSGTAEPNSTVTVIVDGVSVGIVTANASGVWSFTPVVQLPEGGHTVSARATDAAGNTGATSSPVPFVVDTVAPAAPAIVAPTSGAVLTTATPTFSGTAEASSTVTVTVGGTAVCTATANASGAWSCTSGTTLPQGSQTASATARDAAGNISPASTTAFSVDTVAPTAPVISAPASNAQVNTATPTFSGTAEANSTVTVTVGGTTVCTATANASGAWSCASAVTLPQGSQTASVTARDAVGNTSPASTRTFTVDTVAPAVPTISAPANGTSISTATPTYSGTAEPNSSVTVVVDGVTLGTVTANGSGAWSIPSAATLPEGSHTVTATAKDGAGNPSPTASSTFTVDTLAPTAPVISTPANGTSVATTTPTFSGTAEANSTVTVTVGGSTACTTTANASGAWSCASGITLPQGSQTASATAKDATGNVSPTGTSTFTVDTVAPAPPAFTAPASNAQLNTATPTFSGTAEANSTVTVTVGGSTVCTATTNASGVWSCTSAVTLAQGSQTASATAKDAAGNTGPASTRTFTVDTVAPTVPVISTPANGTRISTATPTYSGTAEANSTVTVVVDGVTLGTVTATAGGAWSIPSATTLPEGSHTVTATAKDAAGNSSPTASSTFTVDTVAPAAPVVSAPASNAQVNTTAPTFSGTAEAGSTVTVTVGGTAVCTATANASGAWSCTSTVTLPQGSQTASVTAKDSVGNTSPASTRTFTVDTQAPAVPVIAAPSNGTRISTATPIYSGTAEANSTVTVVVDGVTLGTVTANGSGAWSIPSASTLSEGSHTVTATAKDGAGNPSPTASSTFTVDTLAPSAPVFTSPASDTSIANPRPALSGTAEPGSTVTLVIDGTSYGPIAVDGSGFWTFTPPSALPEGPHTVTATAKDTVGNTSTPSTLSFSVDTVAPAAPIFSTPANNTSVTTPTPTFSGTAEANSTVTVTVGGTTACTTTASGSGAWSCASGITLPQGSQTASATAKDAAGNISAPATTTFTVDSVAPASPAITSPVSGSPLNDATPAFSGTAEPGSTVTLVINSTTYGPISVDGSGDWSFTVPTDLPDGTLTVTATARDTAGNTSAPTTATYPLDTLAPAAPVIEAPARDAVVTTRTPVISGTAEAHSTVTVTVDGTVIATAVADDGGQWSITAPSPLAQGAHTATATARDASGNVSAPTANRDFTVDSLAPDTILTSHPSPVTKQTSATFEFTSPSADTVGFRCSLDHAAVAPCTSAASYTGLGEGTHHFAVAAVDSVGNEDADPAVFDWRIDLTPPQAPIIVSPTNGEVVPTGSPTLTGTVEPGTAVLLSIDSTPVGPVSVDVAGQWSYSVPATLAEGAHVVTATARDAAGNTSPEASSTFIVDTVAPDTSIVSGPASPTRETSATFDLDFTGDAVGYECSLDQGDWKACEDPATFTVTEGEHSLRARAVDAARNADATPPEHRWTVDLTPPDTVIVSGPKSPTHETTAMFELASPDGGVRFECSLDGLVSVPCATTTTLTGLADGPHTLQASAVDAAGNVDPIPATYTWTVDTVPPAAPVVVTPPEGAVLGEHTPVLSGTAEPGSQLFLTVGSTPFGPFAVDGNGHWSFTLPFDLAEGTNTLVLSAQDALGNRSAATTHVLIGDFTAPDTLIASHPPERTGATSASFTFTASEPGATYECSLDGAAFTPCDPAQSFTVAAGDHTLEVRARDRAGNVDGTPDTWSWTVDTTAPAAPLITAPTAGARLTTPLVTYTGTAEPGSTVRVVVDGTDVGVVTAGTDGQWTLASSSPLPDGAHTVTATATDDVGNTGQAASVPFTVDTRAPETRFLATPRPSTQDRDATFEFDADEAPTTFECGVDGGPFAPCTSPVALSGLADGTYTFAVRARDAAGNVDATPATFTWKVDTVAPDTFIVSGPPKDDAPNPAIFDLDSNEAGVTYECSLDGAAFTPCADPAVLGIVAPGAHTLAVRAVDAAGNEDPVPATYTWSAKADTDGDGLSDVEEGTLGTDPTRADTDEDGLSDGVEVSSTRTDPLDDDSDDDGLLDGTEDANHDGATGDGETDPTRADTDGDGLSDGLESGLALPEGRDTKPESFTADADPSTTTDPLKVDSDGGGVLDNVEDRNGNGRVDAGETDPRNPSDDVDADGDGVDNNTERELKLDPFDVDTDDDGVMDGLDGITDTDGDGVVDALDADSDNDGVLDGTERGVTQATAPAGTNTASPNFVPDADPATTTDPRSPDTDGDGLADGAEDANHDGRVQATETDPRKQDTDDDGLGDAIELRGANPTNPLEADTDGDGLMDGTEDMNGNGSLDARETNPNAADTDQGGASDGEEVRGGTDPLDINDDFVVAGQGCTTSGTGSLAPLALALLGLPLLARRRRARTGRRGPTSPVAAALALIVALAGGSARAQTLAASQAIDVQQYKPGPGAYDVLGLHSARVASHLSWNLGASLNYSHHPLNLLDPRQDTFPYRIVSSQVSLDLMGAVSLFDRLEVGLSLPVTTTSSQPAAVVSPDFANGVGTTGIGDLRVVPKVALLSSDNGLHLGVVLPFTLPTAGGSHFLGTGGPSFQPRVVGEWTGSALRVLANVGANFRREEQLRNLHVGNELAFGLGAEVPLTQVLSAEATLAGAIGLEEANTEERPLEVLGALKYRFANGLAAHAGAGPGLTRGYGTPGFRLLAGLTWTPPATPARAAPACALGPEDYDGFQDGDGCLDPDDDADGIPDTSDVCPTDPETRNGFKDEDGCPDTLPAAPVPDPAAPEATAPLALVPPPVDKDQDGLLDFEDRCPSVPEDADGFEDADGCPETDNDRDGIADAKDACPLEAEAINGVTDDDGCPDKGQSKVRLEGSRIVILDKVYFATNKDVILLKSYGLLAQVASILQAHPELEKVRVEGHTDSQGDDAKNLDLSQRRAGNVRAYLVKVGIAPERLDAVGFGEARPVDTNKTARGRENNRRVEFNILKTAEPSAERGTP